MFERSPLSVAPEHLSRLGPELAVEYFRRLLWAEGLKLGISRDLINVSAAINVSDGGVDAEVHCTGEPMGLGIIKPGFNSYQVKTGPFNPTQTRSIDDLLFVPRSRRRGQRELQPRVKACLDQGGRFVVVLFGWDNPDIDEGSASAGIRLALRNFDEAYADAAVEVWRPNQLMGCFEAFPSLALDLNGLAGEPFDTHQTWSAMDTMQREYHAGAMQLARIDEIRAELRESTSTAQIRVSGEPGIGKTRLVLEASNTDDLRPSVVYYENPEALRTGVLFRQLVRADSPASAILIVDECEPETAARIWDRVRAVSHRVKLITIHADETRPATNQHQIPVPPLPREEISQIIRRYIQQPDEADRWAAVCEGSPRVAHAVGESLQQNPGDVFSLASLDQVWKRYLGVEQNRGASGEIRQRVLQYLALFKRFGYAGAVASEAREIFDLIVRSNPELSWDEFRAIIHDLRERKILQGERTLYISPRLCHVWLWAGWWERYGDDFSFTDITRRCSAPLVDWFQEMFEYAATSDAAATTVQRLLGPSGPFEGRALLDQPVQARFLRILADAEPERVLRLLQRVAADWTDLDLRSLSASGRQEFVWILEQLAQPSDLFSEAARLLLRLAETDPEPLE